MAMIRSSPEAWSYFYCGFFGETVKANRPTTKANATNQM
jgi:hypothetical protein